MRKRFVLLFPVLALAACGPRDRCEAPPAPKLMTVKGMSLVDKANALGVPPSRVPAEPKSASSYNALVDGMNENSEAQAVYETFVDRKNAVLKREACVQTEAYKARHMKDEMNTLARAVTATCQAEDEQAVLAALLKYRNCAVGN